MGLCLLQHRFSSARPDNPCPIRFQWQSMTRVHVSDHMERQSSDSERSLAAVISAARSICPCPNPSGFLVPYEIIYDLLIFFICI